MARVARRSVPLDEVLTPGRMGSYGSGQKSVTVAIRPSESPVKKEIAYISSSPTVTYVQLTTCPGCPGCSVSPTCPGSATMRSIRACQSPGYSRLNSTYRSLPRIRSRVCGSSYRTSSASVSANAAQSRSSAAAQKRSTVRRRSGAEGAEGAEDAEGVEVMRRVCTRPLTIAPDEPVASRSYPQAGDLGGTLSCGRGSMGP